MKNRLWHTIISFLVILIVNLGTSVSGSGVCLSGGPECEAVPACCAEMADSSDCEPSGTAQPLSGSSNCCHDNICLTKFQPIDALSGSTTLEHGSTFVPSHLSSEAQRDLLGKAATPVVLQSPLEKTHPLYLRNCSFLI